MRESERGVYRDGDWDRERERRERERNREKLAPLPLPPSPAPAPAPSSSRPTPSLHLAPPSAFSLAPGHPHASSSSSSSSRPRSPLVPPHPHPRDRAAAGAGAGARRSPPLPVPTMTPGQGVHLRLPAAHAPQPPTYTLLAAGSAGCGKTSLLRLLLDTLAIAPSPSPPSSSSLPQPPSNDTSASTSASAAAAASCARFVAGAVAGGRTTHVRECEVDVCLPGAGIEAELFGVGGNLPGYGSVGYGGKERKGEVDEGLGRHEGGEVVRLHLIDTPGLDTSSPVALDHSLADVLRVIEARFEESLEDVRDFIMFHFVFLSILDSFPPSFSMCFSLRRVVFTSVFFCVHSTYFTLFSTFLYFTLHVIEDSF